MTIDRVLGSQRQGLQAAIQLSATIFQPCWMGNREDSIRSFLFPRSIQPQETEMMPNAIMEEFRASSVALILHKGIWRR